MRSKSRVKDCYTYNMVNVVTVGASAARTTHISHHNCQLHPIDLPYSFMFGENLKLLVSIISLSLLVFLFSFKLFKCPAPRLLGV